MNNTKHLIDFTNPKIPILGTTCNQTLLILEMLKIHKMKPQINVDQSSIVLYLFNTLKHVISH